MKNYQKEYTVKALNTFLENTFELAFGDDAINKGYTMKEVVDTLKEMLDQGHEATMILLGQYSSIDDFERVKKQFTQGLE